MLQAHNNSPQAKLLSGVHSRPSHLNFTQLRCAELRLNMCRSAKPGYCDSLQLLDEVAAVLEVVRPLGHLVQTLCGSKLVPPVE